MKFEVVIAFGSSKQIITERILASEGFAGNFLATETHLIYVHHCSNHQVLRDEYGMSNSELLAAGNFGVVEEKRFVTRFRSSYGTESEYDPVLIRDVDRSMFAFFRKMRKDLVGTFHPVKRTRIRKLPW